MATFGELFSKARRESGLTQNDVAERLGISVRTVQHYEQDQRTPPLKKVQQICDVLGVSASYFAGAGSDTSPPDIDDVSPQERAFLKWVEDNLEGSFFYDFDKSPEDAKKHMMETLRLVWERERGRKPGQKQGE